MGAKARRLSPRTSHIFTSLYGGQRHAARPSSSGRRHRSIPRQRRQRAVGYTVLSLFPHGYAGGNKLKFLISSPRNTRERLIVKYVRAGVLRERSRAARRTRTTSRVSRARPRPCGVVRKSSFAS